MSRARDRASRFGARDLLWQRREWMGYRKQVERQLHRIGHQEMTMTDRDRLSNVMTSRTGSGARPLLVLAAAALWGPAVHAASLVSYDTFPTSLINPALWQGDEGKQYGGNRAEVRRYITGGQLRLEARGYSDPFSNAGTSWTRNALIFSRSAAITAMGATVTMATATVSPCTANTSPSVARARLFGFFFNAGNPVVGSNYNDVYAGIQVYRASNSTDPTGVMRVQAYVGICTDDSCIGSTTLASTDMGTVALNTPVALQIAWNQGSNLFAFTRDGGVAANLTYAVSDTQPASYPVKRLEANNQIAHCTAAKNLSAFTAATFDDVQTNALPAQPSAMPIAIPADSRNSAFDETVGPAQ